jgi:hypothetical protein
MRVAVTAIAIALLCYLAIASDVAALPNFVLAIKTAVLGGRFDSLMLGFVTGILLFIYRDSIARNLRKLFEAVIGQSSWALTIAAGALLLIALIFVLKPELFDNLETFKAGNLEAKFAQKSSNIIQAHFDTNGVSRKFTLAHLEEFKSFYLDDNAPRAKASEWFDKTPGRLGRRRLIKLLWPNYIDPVIKSLACMKTNEALERARRESSYIRLATIWRNFLVKLNEKTGNFSRDAIKRMLIDSKEHVREIVRDAVQTDGDCMEIKAPKIVEMLTLVDPAEDANLVWRTFDEIKKELKEERADNSEIYAFTLLDPYIVGTIGDLIAFEFGHKEKAYFLMQIFSKYTSNMEAALPGIINMRYQLADAKLHSEAIWPLDEVIEEIDLAMLGADTLIIRSHARIGEAPASARTSMEIRDNAKKIVEVYLRNRFYFLGRILELYNQRALSGEYISDFHRQKWIGAISHLNAINHARSKAPALAFDGLPGSSVDTETVRQWPLIKVDPEQEFDGDVAIALSIILHGEQRSRASAAACAAANFYLSKAKDSIKAVVDDGKLTAADDASLRQYTLSVADRVKAVCG